MVEISDKAKAITALQTEIQKLMSESQAISDKQWAIHTKFERDMVELGHQQKLILEKVTRLEVSIFKIFNGD
jgi:hypothetical protein